jgi:inosine-uridine nucleoside N-ribohydrolase
LSCERQGFHMTRKIIIDTDPGQDDAVAILLALASPEEVEVLGITAVAGNVPLALTERNARIVCELAGRRDIPFSRAATRRWNAASSRPNTSMARPGSTASCCRSRPCPCSRRTRSIS